MRPAAWTTFRRWAVRTALIGLAATAAIVLAAAVLIRTDWGRDRLRRLIVAQANQHLAATLSIGQIDGSLVGGIRLRDVRLSQGGDVLVDADEIAVSYSIGELFGDEIVLRDLRLVRARVTAGRDASGRWNWAGILRQRQAESPASGPARPVRIDRITLADTSVSIDGPLTVGAAHLPTRYRSIDGQVSFARTASGWQLRLDELSFAGDEPVLAIDALSGTINVRSDGWSLEHLVVRSARSDFTVTARIDRAAPHDVLAFDVRAEAFVFQEWAPIVHGLRRIAVDAAFDLRLEGPTDRLATELTLRSNGGDVTLAVDLDVTVPGWRAAGSAAVARVDLARWFDAPDRPSDITGTVTFELDLDLGGRFPRGSYRFSGPHARFLEYEARDVAADGTLTGDEAIINRADLSAYGARVRLAGSTIGVDDPLPFHFRGRIDGLDLRRLPPGIPVPHVESTLAFEFDASGRFQSPALAGRARFSPSRFIGASIGQGAVGAIDTTGPLLTYEGQGVVEGLSLSRAAAELEVGWLKAPRYHGIMSGEFNVQGQGTDAATLRFTGGGRLAQADLAVGRLAAADVTLALEAGTLTGSYAGSFENLNPAVALEDDRFAAALSGSGRAAFGIRDLLLREPSLGDVDVEADLSIDSVLVGDMDGHAGALVGSLSASTLRAERIALSGPVLTGEASGLLTLGESGTTDMSYRFEGTDLTALSSLVDAELSGSATLAGRLAGSGPDLRTNGTAALSDVETSGIRALSADVAYDVAFRLQDLTSASAAIEGRATFVDLFGEGFDSLEGRLTYRAGAIDADLHLARGPVMGRVLTSLRLPGSGRADISALRLEADDARWQLTGTGGAATVTWDEAGLAITPVTFSSAADPAQRIDLSGTWRFDGSGALRVTATRVALETLPGFGGDTPYAGVLTLDAVVTGTRERPIVTGDLLIANGRVRELTYDEFSGRIEYVGGMFEIGVRLDQSPGVWLTASGAVPLGLIDRTQPERPMYLAIASTPVSLGLIEGLTGIVADVTGQVQLNVSATGTSHDPRFTGVVVLSDAGFVVAATGGSYQRGHGVIELTRDRMTVEDLRLEDRAGRLLQVTGSVGTTELRLEDLALEVKARGFEVVRNEYGTVSADAALRLHGRVEAPQVEGTVTITDGQLRADRILDRVLFPPYALEDSGSEGRPVDAIAALNPWDRLSMDVAVSVPSTLRLTGDNVQVTTGTPLGIGNIDLRLSGNLRLRKVTAGRLSVTGALDQITGRYAFQGRRFDLDPSSSITFRGDFEPELQVMVHRLISGVDVRVAITGPLSDPALQLTSAPPLDSSDILSLIVFNTTANELSITQQEQLAVRAGTLAAGFLAAPLVTALERSLGIDLLEIEAPDTGGARVTIGDEIAPGLVARFSRQFGTEAYDEATLEYYLSRLFRIRATFSDAGSTIRSPFRRVERAGIDFLLFFSF